MIKGLRIKEPGEKQLTHFGWGAALLALALACWFYYKTGELTTNSVIIWGSVSFLFVTVTLTSRTTLRAIFILW
ncbi:hypothetical protein JYT16_02820, partial [Gemmatimonas aurantiaca]|nr:hypothetical protein [Gemmatimonas aurantiaca]